MRIDVAIGDRRWRAAWAAMAFAAVVSWSHRSDAAIEFWTSDDGLRTVELAPSLKLFFFGATGFIDEPGWFLDMSSAERDLLGTNEWLYPNVGGGLLGRVRLRFLADLSSRVRFVVHYEHRPRVMSHGRILSAASSSLQGDESVPLRIYPFQWVITDSAVASTPYDEVYGPEASTFVWEHEIDRLFFSFTLPGADITIGRQAVGWGVGRLWSPLDVFAPLTATDLDREERRGIDAVKVTFPFSSTAFLEVVLAAGRGPNDDGDDEIAWSASSIAWMLRWNRWGIDWMLMAGKVGTDEVVGGAVAGQIRGIGVRGEVTGTTDEQDDVNMRATLGLEFGTSFNLIGILEYHYNGFGVLHTRDYLTRAQELSSRLSRGQVAGLAQHYLGATLAYQPISDLSLSLVYIQNLQDGSLMLGPAIEYIVSDEVRISFAGFVPIGKDAEWRGTSLLDTELMLHSEYGVSSQLYVLQVRINI